MNPIVYPIHGIDAKDIYQCSQCQTERKWGAALYPETTTAELNCAKCAKPTMHVFVRVER